MSLETSYSDLAALGRVLKWSEQYLADEKKYFVESMSTDITFFDSGLCTLVIRYRFDANMMPYGVTFSFPISATQSDDFEELLRRTLQNIFEADWKAADQE